MSKQPRYQCLISLDHSDPQVWRRVLVPPSIPLSSLHEVIQAAMGWDNEHLYHFKVGKQTFSEPDFDLDTGLSSHDTTLADCLGAVRKRLPKALQYLYDFGDSWYHTVRVEALVDVDAASPWAECIEGAGACPLEDCGGVMGYARLCAILNNPDDPEYAEWLDWAGDPIDPAAFDLAAAQRAVAALA